MTDRLFGIFHRGPTVLPMSDSIWVEFKERNREYDEKKGNKNKKKNHSVGTIMRVSVSAETTVRTGFALFFPRADARVRAHYYNGGRQQTAWLHFFTRPYIIITYARIHL